MALPLDNKTCIRTAAVSNWSAATAANPYIRRSLQEIAGNFQSTSLLRMHTTAPVLCMMGRSQEIRDGFIGLRKYPDDPQWLLDKYGVPPMLYGMKVVQEPDGGLPDDWVVFASDSEPNVAVVAVIR